jgi:hypothetical protein
MEFTTLGSTSSQWIFIVGNSCNNQPSLDLNVDGYLENNIPISYIFIQLDI